MDRDRLAVVRGLALACCLAAAAPAQALYGSSPVPAGEGAAAVSLQWKTARSSGGCSGSLVGPRLVLTAAHCVRTPKGKVRTVKTVRVGNPAGATTKAKVTAVHVHPDYDPAQPERGADLAVLVLAEPVADRPPLPLATADDDPTRQGTKLTVRGFGLTRKGRRLKKAKGLQQVLLEHLSPFHCFAHRAAKEMARTRACAASTTAGVCPGDSGAPVTIHAGDRDVLVGVVSLALDQDRCAETAAVMTRVSTYRDWVLGLRP